MIQKSNGAENTALLTVAQNMCVAARTAPKTKGIDLIETCIVTSAEKDTLAGEMERFGAANECGFFSRDAQNVRDSFAVILIGIKNQVRGLGAACGYCNYKDCADCYQHGGLCAYGPIDLGIAVGSAVSVAASARVDCRVMFSIGRTAQSLGWMGEDVQDVLGIPISALGKSPYFDR